MTSKFITGIKPYAQPAVLAIFVLGFFSGLPLSLTVSTLTVWLTEVGITKSSIGLFAIVGTPYTLKFLWAPLMDNVKLGKFSQLIGRRKAWIVLSQIFLALTLLGLGFSNPAESALATAFWALLVTISSASQDIVIDAYRVERLNKNQLGPGAAAINFGYRIGMLFSGAGALFMADAIGWQMTYLIMSAIFVAAVFITLSLKEPAFKEKQRRSEKFAAFLKRAVIEPFADFIKTHKNWIYILIFIIAYKLGDALAGMMTNPFLIELGFTKTQIATIVKTYGLVATLLGVFIGGSMVRVLGMPKSLLICGVLQLLSNFVFIFQFYAKNDPLALTLTITVENLASGMGAAAFVAYLSSLCNIRFTATQYALFSSLAVMGRTWLSASSGFIVDNLGWVEFFIISAIAAIPGLLLIKLIKK